MYTIFENDVTDSGTPRSVHTLRGVHAGRVDLTPNHLYITTYRCGDLRLFRAEIVLHMRIDSMRLRWCLR